MDAFSEAYTVMAEAQEQHRNKAYDGAYYLYMQAIEQFLRVSRENPKLDPEVRETVKADIDACLGYAAELKAYLDATASRRSRRSSTSRRSGGAGSGAASSSVSTLTSGPTKSAVRAWQDNAFRSAERAIAAQKLGHSEKAEQLYIKASQLFLKALPHQKEENQVLLRSKVAELLDAAESLRSARMATRRSPRSGGVSAAMFPAVPRDNGSGGGGGSGEGGAGKGSRDAPVRRSPSPGQSRRVPASGASATSSAAGYTEAEKKVLQASSFIKGAYYPPWDEKDLDELSLSPRAKVYQEPDLKLAQRQLERGPKWLRAQQVVPQGSTPSIISLISPYPITQTVVGDCSFVASLAVAAAYERKHDRVLVSSFIYPQKNGKPVFAPNGKYMVKLHLNGVDRKVIIDDRIPCDASGQPMCSYSNNRSELWVTLMEKAYLKVMGGYDFPGSNSGVDLHALYGWIPEDIDTRGDKLSGTVFDPEATWKLFKLAFDNGMCLFTISTGEISPTQEEQLGLYRFHAYAVLDVREIGRVRLLQVKNPWAEKRWKGKYSASDKASWTAELQRALGYNLMKEFQADNGVFWIDWDSILKYYQMLHLSWNPKQFEYSTRWHGRISANLIPRKLDEIFELGSFPQYVVEVGAAPDSRRITVWLLMSKHVEKPPYEDDFIALHVVNGFDGNRVYYTEKLDLLHRGVYRNNAHYLAKVETKPSARLTVIASTFQRSTELRFTLAAYATVPIVMKEMPQRYVAKTSVDGEWTDATAGGTVSDYSYYRNPQFRLRLHQPLRDGLVKVRVNAPDRAASVNFHLLQGDGVGGGRFDYAHKQDTLASGELYRPHLQATFLRNIPAGDYTIVVSTYRRGTLGQFTLDVVSDTKGCLGQLRPLPPPWHGAQRVNVTGEFTAAASGGCPNNAASFARNPSFHISSTAACRIVCARLLVPKLPPQTCTGIHVFSADDSMLPQMKQQIASSGDYRDPVTGTTVRGVDLPARSQGYLLVVATYQPGVLGPFELELITSHAVQVKQIR